jgi:hypothetical protein
VSDQVFSAPQGVSAPASLPADLLVALLGSTRQHDPDGADTL